MRALPHYYDMELHNFNPNSIAQAAIFVAVYEGYLGTSGTRKAVRAGGCTLQVR